MLALLVGARLALPVVLAPMIAARLTRALGTPVTVGDISLHPLDAIVTLHDVTVAAPAGSGAGADDAPIVAERVRVDVQWLPLMHRIVQVRELRLESARVELDRFEDGGFGLANLERADPARELPDGWSFVLDRIAFRDTRLAIHDLAAGGAPQIEATLRAAEIAGLRRRATAFGKANNVRVDAELAGGELRVRGRYDRRDDGVVLDLVMRVKDIPLAEARGYVAGLGWTDVWGKASGLMRWQRDPRRRDLLTGRVVLRRGGVRVAGLEAPALEVRGVVAEIGAIDLLRRRIGVRSLVIKGATVALRPDAVEPLPLIAAQPAAPPPPRRLQRTAVAAASPPQWGWMIEQFHTDRARVRVLADEPFDLRAVAAGENLGPEAYWSPLRIAIEHEQIALAFDGTARVGAGVGIEGRLTAAGIDFPATARAVRLPWADLVHAGSASLDVTVQYETRPPDDSAPFHAHGNIQLSDVRLGGFDPGAVALSASSVSLTLQDVALTGIGPAGGTLRRPRIVFSRAVISQPQLLLLRGDDGWIVPLPASSDGAAAEQVADVVLNDVSADGGRMTLVDLVPRPPVMWSVANVGGSASGLTLPGLQFTALKLHGSDRRFGGLTVAGSRSGAQNRFELIGRGVPLAATAPYLALAGLPYRFAAGRGSFTARGSIGAGGWSADTVLTLQGPAFADGEPLLEQAIGMPLPSVYEALRDANGDVTVQMPLTALRGESGQVFSDRIAAGVRGAIVRARDEQLAAAEFARALAPRDVPFPPGQSELTMQANRVLASVAALAASRQDLQVEVDASSSASDRRWLAEQAVAKTLTDSGGGFRDMLRALGVSDEQQRIRTALEARARGEAGPLDADDAAALARMVALGPPVDDQLAALREARLVQVLNHLSDFYGLDGSRVVVRDAGSTTGTPVRVQLSVRPPPPPERVVAPAAAAAPPPPPPVPRRPPAQAGLD